MMNYLVPDMDDISLDNPDANGLNYAFYLKGKFPKFKVTFFCIPGRSNREWLQELSRLDWIEIQIHGNMHDEDEIITQKMIWGWPMSGSKEFDFTLYKGPNWKVTSAEENILEQNFYRIVTKKWTLNTPEVVHGHTWVKADWERLESMITAETEFKFTSEVLNG